MVAEEQQNGMKTGNGTNEVKLEEGDMHWFKTVVVTYSRSIEMAHRR